MTFSPHKAVLNVAPSEGLPHLTVCVSIVGCGSVDNVVASQRPDSILSSVYCLTRALDLFSRFLPSTKNAPLIMDWLLKKFPLVLNECVSVCVYMILVGCDGLVSLYVCIPVFLG